MSSINTVKLIVVWGTETTFELDLVNVYTVVSQCVYVGNLVLIWFVQILVLMYVSTAVGHLF